MGLNLLDVPLSLFFSLVNVCGLSPLTLLNHLCQTESKNSRVEMSDSSIALSKNSRFCCQKKFLLVKIRCNCIIPHSYHGGSLEQLLDKSENKSRAFANKLARWAFYLLELLSNLNFNFDITIFSALLSSIQGCILHANRLQCV